MIQIYENYYRLLKEYNKLFTYFKDNASWRDDIKIEDINTVDELINFYNKETEEEIKAEKEYIKLSLKQIEFDEKKELDKEKFCKCVMCEYCKNDVPF